MAIDKTQVAKEAFTSLTGKKKEGEEEGLVGGIISAGKDVGKSKISKGLSTMKWGAIAAGVGLVGVAIATGGVGALAIGAAAVLGSMGMGASMVRNSFKPDLDIQKHGGTIVGGVVAAKTGNKEFGEMAKKGVDGVVKDKKPVNPRAAYADQARKSGLEIRNTHPDIKLGEKRSAAMMTGINGVSPRPTPGLGQGQGISAGR